MSPGVFDSENPPEDEDDEQPDDEEQEDEGTEEEAPPPATWAGRQAWGGLPEDEAPEDDEAGEDEAAEDDEEIAAAGEDEAADATADEGAEPGDEFEFDDEEPQAADEADGAEEPESEDGEDPADAESDPEPEEAPVPASDEGSDPTSDETDAEESAGEEKADEPEGEAADDSDGDEADEAEGEKPKAGATTETDTLAAADQEEAREAALEGLRNRTAEHAKKRGVTDPGKAPAAGAGAAEAADADEETAAEDDAEPAEAATAVAAVAAADDGEVSPEEQKPPRSGLWPRFMAATFLIVASMAAATAVSVLVYLTDIAKGLGGLPGIVGQLDDVGDQKAQNFLIIGSDVRPDQSSKGLSDTTMLLRVDPDNAITQLSIPRDLRVNIPGHGIDKFNAAYSYGGPKLTLKVVKQLTDDRIPINHVVNVDFNGFADAVDAIGCVYVDVDRHYFNDNSTAASFADQYAEIDIEAGYQRLCGYKALQYVRFRHEDNDIVRSARQQGFLREARQKVPPEKLLDQRETLIEIFKEHTTSDIDDSGTLVELFKLMIDARNAQIAQIEFPFDSLDDEGYVTAGDDALQNAVSQFLGEKPTGAPPPPEPKEPDKDGGGEKPKPEEKPKPKPEPKPEPDEPEQTPEQIAASQMIDATGAAQAQAAAIIEEGGKDLKFPVLYPTRIMPSGNATISDDSRYFGIDGGNGKLYHGYKFVMTMQGSTYPVAYYGVSGTDWLDAPLFANPSDKRKIGEREYMFYRDGGRLRMVAFQRDKTMYWVTNTLDKLLTEPQMIAIAQNLRQVGS